MNKSTKILLIILIILTIGSLYLSILTASEIRRMKTESEYFKRSLIKNVNAALADHYSMFDTLYSDLEKMEKRILTIPILDLLQELEN